MAKKSKLATPEWILAGCDSPAEYEKRKGGKVKHRGRTPKDFNEKSLQGAKKSESKVFKVRKCPKCNSDEVGVVLVGAEGKKADNWECRKCGWKGKEIKEEELSEDEFLEYLEEKNE